MCLAKAIGQKVWHLAGTLVVTSNIVLAGAMLPQRKGRFGESEHVFVLGQVTVKNWHTLKHTSNMNKGTSNLDLSGQVPQNG